MPQKTKNKIIPPQNPTTPLKNEMTDIPNSEVELFKLSIFPILDIQEGIKTTGTEKILYDMLQLMLKYVLTEDMSMLKTAHQQGDWEKIQKFAHKIKGGAMYVGAIRMKMACHYLECYWKKGQHPLLEKLYQQMLHVVEESELTMNVWIRENNHIANQGNLSCD